VSDTQYAQPTPPPPPAYTPPPAAPRNGLATAGFVVALLGLLGSFIPVLNIGGMILGVVGAILAVVGLTKVKTVGVGKGLAIAGIVLGGLAVIIAIIVNVLFVAVVKDSVDEVTDTTVQVPADSSDDAAGDDEGESDDEGKSDEKAAEVGTSRSNPAPIGSAISGGDWTVTINSVSTVDKDSMDQTAEAGKVLLLINLTATYTGTDEQGDTAWASVDFVSADGTTYDGLDESGFFIPEDQFDSLTTLYEGGSVTGNKILEVPENWQDGVLAVSPALFKDDTFVAVK